MMKLKLIAASFALAWTVSPAMADDLGKYQEESRQVAKAFVQQLGGELQKEMQSGGPASAIKVCKNVAPAIASELSRKNGWHVSRVSLKPRNPLLGFPDAWEQKVLKDFDARKEHGEAPTSMEYAEIVTEPQGKFFRYMKAIPVQEACLACHGTNIAPNVKEALTSDYPHDQATGYSVGQIRGAITIKRPL